MDPKEKRNAQIISMHNAGKSIREIAEATGVSKTLVSNVITKHIESLKTNQVQPIPATNETKAPGPAKQMAPASTDKGKRITNFGEYHRTDVNTYAHKATGEVIKVKFVPATAPNECGYFVTV